MRTEDSQIISKCLNGDKAAFGFLVDKYKASVYALAYYRLRNFEDAEDITQEVFIEAYQRLHTLRRWDSFSVWLYSITSNMCKEFLRSKSRRRDREYIADQNTNILRNESINSYHENKVYESLREALDTLPDIYQQVLTLYYLGGMTSEEIAKLLGISSATIRQRMSRARSQLREEILAMMGDTFEQKKLSVSFTFRIVEAIKRVRIQPMSPKALPWGLSLATGIIISFLTLGQHLNIINPIGMMKGSPLPSMTKVLKVGEIPVDVVKISNAPIISSQRWNGTGLGSVVPSLQNALFMASQGQGDTWTKKADISIAREGLACCTVNGKIYAIGGVGLWNAQAIIVEEYDPIADKWIRKADMPTARWDLSTSVVNGKIYAIGGQFWEGMKGVFLATVEEYDPMADKWTKKSDMPTARCYLSTSVVNGKIYAIGGGDIQLQTVEEYDPVADKWTKKADMPTARSSLGTNTVNGKIYAIGGASGVKGIISLATVEEYDPVADKWTKKSDMPTQRSSLTTATVNGKIYAIGGSKNIDVAFNTVEEYDPVTDKWTKKADMPTARSCSSSSEVNGKIYVIGGWDHAAKWFVSAVEEYDPGIAEEDKNVQPKGKLPTTWGDVKLARNK
jgi:RNA polymerase sigma factor (sigma-70 family)